LAAQAQIMLFAVNGTAESPVGATYQVGNVAVGDSKDTRLRARNSGTASVTVSNISLSGAGFTIIQTPSPPFVIAPGSFQDVYVRFTGTTLASYSANLQIVYGASSVTALMLATVVAAPSVATLAVGSGCSGPDPNTNTIDFGPVRTGQTAPCSLSLLNRGTQSLTISAVGISGSGFQFADTIRVPIVLPAGGSYTFAINFAPVVAGVFSGMMTVDARSYLLSGVAFNPTLTTPIIEFDSGVPASAQQRTLTMRLPSPAPVAASGSVLLSFQSGTTMIADDPAVVFIATGARSVPFSIKAGDTQFTLGGQAGAVFQTGTTSGKIRFSLSTSATLSGTASAEMAIPFTAIHVDTATATRRAGDLDIQVWGFDNAYSAGTMSFTFYDLAGSMVQPGAVSADFTPQFRTFFTSAQAGSAFQMRVSFPVTGDSGQIGAVDVKLTNSAGSVVLQHLSFQ
jgi:hypothetical protein